jgi:serine/threonine-protein kinase
MGALKYIPPEQIRGLGPLDARSDLYSAGVVLYEALTGRLPFESNSQFKVMMDHVNTEAPAPSSVNSRVPVEFDSAVLKALAKDPAERYQSADEFRARLEGVKNGLRAKAGSPVLIGVPAKDIAPAAEITESAADDAAPGVSSEPAVVAPATVVLDQEPSVPSFGIAEESGTGRWNVPPVVLGISALLIGVLIVLLVAVLK